MVDLDNINKAFQDGLQLTKGAVLRQLMTDEALFDRVEQWSPPTCLLDAGVLRQSIADGAWATAYGRYCTWHKGEDKRYALRHRQGK